MVIHTSYYDACDVSCDVIYYVIADRARRMVRNFFLPYLGNRSKSDPCSYGLFCLESHILSFPKVLQIPPQTPCMYIVTNTTIFLVVRLLLLRYNYMFRPSMLAIFRLYMRNLSISYTNMCGEFTVCGLGCVRDLVLCWRKGYGLGLFWGLC